ncbi:hypothetical protein KNP414_02926 [Paenibacillus mucilaginosus KNP414]|uniref:Uncharacterized protein n=1 Tax=Paenibacillus mucilaginosus (strain KNP414) TaxID=1036673 RepID=F8F5S0_PAEMK|nr:hypothetical protein KNP414_02926 [Paenibacillus mucilaginosus KNP414]
MPLSIVLLLDKTNSPLFLRRDTPCSLLHASITGQPVNFLQKLNNPRTFA